MKRLIVLLIALCFITIDIYAQVVNQDNSIIITSIGKEKRRHYTDANYIDTVEVDGVKKKVSREALRKRYSNYVQLDGGDSVYYNGVAYTSKELRKSLKKSYKDSLDSYRNVWVSILGGPSYTPEASFGVGGAALLSFSTNKRDSTLFRSFIPVGFNMSANGTIVVAGASRLFFNENKFRVYVSYGYRNEPANFYGVGSNEVDGRDILDDVTFNKQSVYFRPTVLWQVLDEDLLMGFSADLSYYKSMDMPLFMQSHESVKKFGSEYLNIGVGYALEYDTRDNPSMPYKGIYTMFKANFYPQFFGNKSNYTLLSAEFRHYIKLFNRRSTLAYVVRLDQGLGDIPYNDMPTFGSPFDMRGYIMGKYRDDAMSYVIAEYRHMFGSNESYNIGTFSSRIGGVVWVGAGSVREDMFRISQWYMNYGVGLRYEVQPNKNFRLDIGRGTGANKGWLVYMNMVEAF